MTRPRGNDALYFLGALFLMGAFILGLFLNLGVYNYG